MAFEDGPLSKKPMCERGLTLSQDRARFVKLEAFTTKLIPAVVVVLTQRVLGRAISPRRGGLRERILKGAPSPLCDELPFKYWGVSHESSDCEGGLVPPESSSPFPPQPPQPQQCAFTFANMLPREALPLGSRAPFAERDRGVPF